MNQDPGRWSLTLYVSGASPLSAVAIDNVQRICDDQLGGMVDLRIVDVRDQPVLAIAEGVTALPTLVKRMPPPLRQLVGDLSDPDRISVALGLPVPVLSGETEGEVTDPGRPTDVADAEVS